MSIAIAGKARQVAAGFMKVMLFAASVPLTDTMTFTLPLTSALLSVRRAFLLSLSVTLMVLPAPTRFEAFLITTTFFFLPLPLRIFAVIFSDAASLDLTLKTSFLVFSAFWIFLAVIVSFGAVLSVAQGFGRRGWLLPLAVGLYVLVMLTGDRIIGR